MLLVIALQREPFSLIMLPAINLYLTKEAKKKERNNFCLVSSAWKKVRGGVREEHVVQHELMKNEFGGEFLRTAVLSSAGFDGPRCEF